MSKIWGISSPWNRGPQNHLFRRIRNLAATSTAYVSGTKHDIHNWTSALESTRGLLHRLKLSWTLVHKRLKIGPAFILTLRKFCILLHYHASQTEIGKRNSTKLCQTVDSKSAVEKPPPRNESAVEKLRHYTQFIPEKPELPDFIAPSSCRPMPSENFNR